MTFSDVIFFASYGLTNDDDIVYSLHHFTKPIDNKYMMFFFLLLLFCCFLLLLFFLLFFFFVFFLFFS